MGGCARAWNMKIQYCRECIIDMKLITKNKSLFGISKFLYDSAFLNDPNYGPYQVASASIQTKPASININTCTPVESTYQSTKLSSGITVLTESVSVPSNVQLGVFVDVGSRDENAESSGATLLLKNAHLKTAISTNETVNYGIIQMAGAELNLDYGRESGFYRINCLSHDVIDVFSMLVDVALEPRNSVACAVGRSKNEESHLVDAQTGGNQLFNDHLFAAAFQNKSLGRPVFGTRSNVANLTSEVIQKFQLANFTHDRIVISATGIENHQEFVDLVSEKMNLTQLASNAPQRESAKYIGGEIRNFNESSIVHVALAFEGAQYTQGWPLLIANEILNAERRTGLIQTNILNKNVFINDAQSFSASFSDSGLFGLKLSGSASHVNDIVNVGAKTLNSLKNASEAQVEAAKAVLKAKIAHQLTHSGVRLEERTKRFYYSGNVGENYRSEIDSVSASAVTEAVSKALSSPLTFVAQGGQVNTVASWDKLSQLFN